MIFRTPIVVALSLAAVIPGRSVAQSDPRVGCYRADRPLSDGPTATTNGGQGDAATVRRIESEFRLLDSGRVDRPGTAMRDWWMKGSRWTGSGDSLHVNLSTMLVGWDLRLVRERRGGDSVYIGKAIGESDVVAVDAHGRVMPSPPPPIIHVRRVSCMNP